MISPYLGIFFVCCIYTFKQCVQGTSVPCALRSYGTGKYVCVCNATYCDTPETVEEIAVDEFVVITSSKEGQRFNKTTGKFSDTEAESNEIPIISWLTGDHHVKIIVNTSATFQTMLGFGGAFTDAAGINIKSLSEATQEQLLRSYFSKTGIGYSLARVPIGGSDFSTYAYSYDDGEADPKLENFALTNEDYQYKIPLIKRALQMSPKQLRLVSSPWSPPLWMKTNGDWSGFSALKPEHYSTFAKYIVRFLDEYKKHDIKFWGVTTTNEPLNGVIPLARFNSLGWLPSNLANWIVNYLGPELRNSVHSDICLMTYDDQSPFFKYYVKEMVDANPEVLKYIDGLALHWYLDFIPHDEIIDSVHKEHPDKFIIYTEACEGSYPLQSAVDIGSWGRGENYFESIIKNMNLGVVGWIDWNIALNLDGGPNWAKNFVDSPILVNPAGDEFYKQPMYYALGHASTHIQENAVRVEVTPNDKAGIISTAVKNTDGTIVMMLLNKNDKETAMSIKVDNKGWINRNMQAHSFVTVLCS